MADSIHKHVFVHAELYHSTKSLSVCYFVSCAVLMLVFICAIFVVLTGLYLSICFTVIFGRF